MDAFVEVGDILAGKYAVERILASGGSGIVVLARHLQLLEPCAIKILRADAAATHGAPERFLREARAVAQLKSDHVVRVFDVGQLDDGTPYMVMERLEGTDLEGLLNARGALPVDEAAVYGLQICAALAEAHRRGIVHRDLKPANVFVTHAEDGEPRLKLLDFGIAKMLAAPAGVDPLTTLEGTIMGTPFFMAPEQIAGGAVDPRTDVWALGVLLYDLLTGHLPFQSGAPVTSLAKILAQPPTPPSAYRPSTPPDLERIILRCLEKHASARPTSVGEVADALAPFAGARGAPLSRRVHRVLDGASIPDLTPPPVASVTPTLAASPPAIASVAPAPERAEPSPALSQAPRSALSQAPRPAPSEAPRPAPSRAASALAVAAVVLVAAACFALASREAEPRAIPAAEPPPVHAVAPTVVAGSSAVPPVHAHPSAEIATARPSASTPAPAPRGARPAAGGPSAGFDWGDRH